METFGLIGFIFGIVAFTTVLGNANKVRELEKRINDLENKK
ncbi:hypothetical protein [Ureibacillus endophyticus]|nr:hypothetical protein [Lysinibacillus endophyticus]